MTDQMLVKDKAIVVPGEKVVQGMSYLPGPGTKRAGDHIVAQRVGMIRFDGKVAKLIPLNGVYLPKVRDKVVAKVTDVLMSGWRVDINSAYSAVLTMKDATSEFIPRGANLTKYYDVGDWILAQVVNVTSQNLIDVSMKGPGLKKLGGGRFVKVSPFKVPRIIGKEGSMVNMIKQATGCSIVVGQNGRIWISGEPEKEVIAADAIQKIDEEAHLGGLTDRMQAWFKKRTGGAK